MKKRSLVAAIAMLVVSAIVLTSSTYAWFASASGASVGEISAAVANNNGSVSVAPTGDYAKAAVKDIYKNSITSGDYQNLCGTLNPCSMYIAGSAPQFNKVNYNTETFSSFGAAGENSDYLCYQFKVKGANAADAESTKSVTLTPSFTGNTGNFCNGLIAVSVAGANNTTVTTYYSYLAGGSYDALKAVTNSTITDSDGNGIVNTGDAGLAAATDLLASTSFSGVTAGTSGSAITILSGIAANTSKEATVTVWVWAEGQDDGCVGNVTASSAYFSFSVA